jgi:hypothetical protein
VTFPEYSPLAGRRTGQVYPPVAPPSSVPPVYERTYRGTDEIEHRIRRALTAFAIRRWKFWQSSAFVVALGLLVAFTVDRNQWAAFLPTFGVALVMAVGLVGVGILDVGKVSKVYASRHVVYASLFGAESFIWQTATGTYEIRWKSVARVVQRDDVAVLALEDSRAICVLPNELITPDARSRLEVELERRRTGRQLR